MSWTTLPLEIKQNILGAYLEEVMDERLKEIRKARMNILTHVSFSFGQDCIQPVRRAAPFAATLPLTAEVQRLVRADHEYRTMLDSQRYDTRRQRLLIEVGYLEVSSPETRFLELQLIGLFQQRTRFSRSHYAQGVLRGTQASRSNR